MLGFHGRPSDAGVIWEALVERKYRKLQVAPDDVVLDLGAHIGTFAYAAAETGAAVVAVEPHPESHRLAVRNLVAFARANVRLGVVGRGDGFRELRSSRATNCASIVLNRRGAPAAVSAVLDADRLLATVQPTVLKVDVEGAEWEILEPLPDLGRVREGVLELHNIWGRAERATFRDRAETIVAALVADGYRVSYLQNGRYSTDWPVMLYISR